MGQEVIRRIALIGGAALTVGVAMSGCGPDAEARAEMRTKIALCEKNRDNPRLDASGRAQIVAPVCERFKEEFRARFNAEP